MTSRSKWLSSGVYVALFVLVVIASPVVAQSGAAPAARAPSGTDRTVWDGVYSEEQARRGDATYRDACARCHLDNLKGSEQAPALVGDQFIAAWNTKTLRDFYGRVLSTMPADDPGSLDEKAVLDVISYVLQANGFPAGSSALETAEEAGYVQITRARD
jgi:mono/diheme cytochrome c family protein